MIFSLQTFVQGPKSEQKRLLLIFSDLRSAISWSLGFTQLSSCDAGLNTQSRGKVSFHALYKDIVEHKSQ